MREKQVLAILGSPHSEGITAAMLKHSITTAEKAGYQRVSLSVQKENYACRMYEKLGFQVVLEREDEWIMQKQLQGRENGMEGGEADR